MPKKEQTVFEEADAIINGERKDAYGKAEDSFQAIAYTWTGLLFGKLQPGREVTARDVARLMVALKLARETNQRKRDNIVDAAGYLMLHEQLSTE